MKTYTNIIKYKRLAPFYDKVFGISMLQNARKTAFQFYNIGENKQVAILGIGTGEDLKYISSSNEIFGIDISEDMLEICRKKVVGRKNICLINGDIEKFETNNKYDLVVLHLILSVVENPKSVIEKACSIVHDNGRILVFDKFRKTGKVSLGRKLINVFTSAIGTDITRSIEEIISNTSMVIERRAKSILNGNYQILVLKKHKS